MQECTLLLKQICGYWTADTARKLPVSFAIKRNVVAVDEKKSTQ